MTRAVALFRDPMRTFLLLAIVVGGYLVFAVPYFGGIDEPAHFSRSYQISTGQFVPEKIGNSEFSGACLPKDLLREMRGYQAAYFKHLISLFPNALKPAARRGAAAAAEVPVEGRVVRDVLDLRFAGAVPAAGGDALRRASWEPARAGCCSRAGSCCSRCTWRSWRSRSGVRRARSGRCARPR